MRIILPTIYTWQNCNHDNKENVFIPSTEIDYAFHVSMTFYKLSLRLDSFPWFIHIGNLYFTFKISSNINPLEPPWAQVRIDFFLHYAITEIHLFVYISCLHFLLINSELLLESEEFFHFVCIYYLF